MEWNGKKLKIVGDILEGISSCKTKRDAEKFTQLYKSENESAIANIGYLIGYTSETERKRLYDLFGNNHPVFEKCMAFVNDTCAKTK